MTMSRKANENFIARWSVDIIIPTSTRESQSRRTLYKVLALMIIY